jgi:hypothetical protein
MQSDKEIPVGLARRARLIEELRSRLRPACNGWPEELFTAMIENLADITLRYDVRTSVTTYDRRSTDRLIEDLKSAVERNRVSRDRGEADDQSAE